MLSLEQKGMASLSRHHAHQSLLYFSEAAVCELGVRILSRLGSIGGVPVLHLVQTIPDHRTGQLLTPTPGKHATLCKRDKVPLCPVQILCWPLE